MFGFLYIPMRAHCTVSAPTGSGSLRPCPSARRSWRSHPGACRCVFGKPCTPAERREDEKKQNGGWADGPKFFKKSTSHSRCSSVCFSRKKRFQHSVQFLDEISLDPWLSALRPPASVSTNFDTNIARTLPNLSEPGIVFSWIKRPHLHMSGWNKAWRCSIKVPRVKKYESLMP